jgi:hypothetical protein
MIATTIATVAAVESGQPVDSDGINASSMGPGNFDSAPPSASKYQGSTLTTRL